ncbi:MAG: NTP transferase domain-containing protein [Candidatus Pacebacteria bacterium]|nr:NTP transferase domain-containing protein [Candidatus Paceibacterota bacterium]
MSNSYQDHTFAVILAGGGGTRLWPKSRKKTPKQFLKLAGKKTMVQTTADRMSKLVSWDKMIVVTNKIYTQDLKEQLPEIPEENIIAEPAKKDTALAMLVGSLYAKSKDPKAIVINAASDHIVQDEQEFVRVMQAAAKVAAENDYLVSVGITPTDPNTGFGYIKVGEDLKKINKGLSLFEVASFTEKPNRATAMAYLSTGKYFWNANMYVWSAEAIQKAFKKHMPEMYQLTKQLPQLPDKKFKTKLEKIYDQAESISIDYAISEKAENLVLIPGDFGWNDVGLWSVVYDLGKKDLSGNVVISDQDKVHSLAVNSQNNLIHGNGRLVAMYGVNDMVVVDTDEIVLIVPRDKCTDIKKLVQRLKEEGRDDYL